MSRAPGGASRSRPIRRSEVESTALWLEGFAAVALAEGDVERAATAYGAAEALRERTGIQRWPIIRVIFESRLAALDDARPEIEASRFAGRQMTPETAIGLVLGRPPARATLDDPVAVYAGWMLAVGAQNAFAADFHSRRRCAMSSARSSSLPPSSTWRSEGSARR